MSKPNAPEDHWTGPEGDAYTKRQTLSHGARRHMFYRILQRPPRPHSVIEFGANEGQNLEALRELLPTSHLAGVEINEAAFRKMKIVANLAFHGSILEFPSAAKWNMVLTRGLLIHIQPVELLRAYDVLYKASNRLICIAEYYSPTPRMIPYRGQDNLLWARDFAGEMLERYPDLRLVDYEFVYHRDLVAPQDDVTWFLMEKYS
jgi:spore coat polysaccharide biosynthesis protein SpsF